MRKASTLTHKDTSSTRDSNKRARLNRPDALKNQQTVLALSASGLNQRQIAAKSGLSVKTVNRHAQSVKAAIQTARNVVEDIGDELARLQTPRQIAENIVELATTAKNEAVRDSTQRYAIELRGGVTEKERIRAKGNTQVEAQPMFVLPPGCNVAVTFNQQNNTISSDVLPDNGASCRTSDESVVEGQENQQEPPS